MYYYKLKKKSIICIEGKDATTFIQGIITNNTNKLKYLKIEKDLATSVLYDRNFSDILILALKKEMNIDSLECF